MTTLNYVDVKVKVSCIDRITGSDSRTTTLGILTIDWKFDEEEIESIFKGETIHRYSTNMRRHCEAVKI